MEGETTRGEQESGQNDLLPLLVSKSFITSLTSLFKSKLFRKVIEFNFIVFRICVLQVLTFQNVILLDVYLLVSKSLVTSLLSLIKYKLIR